MNQRHEIQNMGTKSRNKAMKKFAILMADQLISSIGSGLTDFGLAISLERRISKHETIAESCPEGL